MSDSELRLQPSGLELFRVTGDGWLLIGTTVAPKSDAPEVDRRCVRCDSAVAGAVLACPPVFRGIHCKHCGNLRRYTYA